MPAADVEITEYTDPACAWCWGSEAKLRRLRWRFGHRLDWRVVLAGVVPESASGRAAPLTPGSQIEGFRRIAGHTSMPSPSVLDRVLPESRTLCRVALAAFGRAPELGHEVLRRLRETIFVFGKVSHSNEEIHASLRGILGDADLWRLLVRADSPEVASLAEQGFAAVRQPIPEVLELVEIGEGSGRAVLDDAGGARFALPTLLLRGPGGLRTVAGWKTAETYERALLEVAPHLEHARRPDPSPAEALVRFGSLTEPELETLCGASARPPQDAVPVATPGGPLWLDVREARQRGLASRAQGA